jgi:hypothetical protein
MRLKRGPEVWSSGIMLALQRLFLGYCMFVIVLVWMLRRAKRLRNKPLSRSNRS